MFRLLNRAFDLREGEAGIVLIMSFLLLINTMSRQMSGIVGIADLINLGGLNQTLLVNAINGLFIMGTAALCSLIVDRFNRIQLLCWTSLAFLLVFGLLLAMRALNAPPKLTAALLYLVSQQQWLVFPMFFWVLCTDMFEMAQAKRVIPAIGSWSFVGKIIGIGFAILPGLLALLGVAGFSSLTMEMVLWTNIAVYLAGLLVIVLGLRGVQIRHPATHRQDFREVMTEGLSFVKEVPSFRFLQIAIMMIAVCDIIVEFHFFVVAKGAIPDPEAYKQFYSYYLLIAAAVSFVVQGFATSRIIQRFQLKNAFLFQPFMAVGSSVAMVLAFGWLPVNVLSSILLKISRNTVDDSTGKAFQALVPEERRGRVALLMNNYMPAVGYILGSVLAAAVVFGGIALGVAWYAYAYLAVSAAAGGTAVWAIFQMRGHYDDSLFNWRLKRRKRATSVLSRLEF